MATVQQTVYLQRLEATSRVLPKNLREATLAPGSWDPLLAPSWSAVPTSFTFSVAPASGTDDVAALDSSVFSTASFAGTHSSCIAAIRCSRWPRLVMPTCQHPSFRRHSSVHVFRAHTPTLFRMHTPVFLSARLPVFGSSSSQPSPCLPYTLVPQMHTCDRHSATAHNLYSNCMPSVQ